MIIIFAFLSSLFLSFVFIEVFKRVFRKINILDNPKKYGKKRDPVPYSMGIIFFFLFFIISYFFVDHNSKLYLIWIFGLIITIISFFDDLLDVNAKIRLFVQIIIGATIGITSIKIGYISNIFGGVADLQTYSFFVLGYEIYIIPLIFTIIWYVFIFNSLNWTDGIPGNTSGISVISFFIIFLLGVILFYKDNYEGGVENAIFIMTMAIILVGIIIPFWFYDVKEKILMGDSGTMFLGFMLATLAIISGGKIATVLVVFGIYSVDAVYVILKRILKKKSPLNRDFTHLHHRLLDKGLTNKQILTLIYSLSFFFGITALFLDKVGKIIVFGIIVFVVVFINNIVGEFKKFKK
ncbi:MAG: MraY family glycosyltransferase [Candidatus Gracilibacteria bacterium]